MQHVKNGKHANNGICLLSSSKLSDAMLQRRYVITKNQLSLPSRNNIYLYVLTLEESNALFSRSNAFENGTRSLLFRCAVESTQIVRNKTFGLDFLFESTLRSSFSVEDNLETRS